MYKLKKYYSLALWYPIIFIFPRKFSYLKKFHQDLKSYILLEFSYNASVSFNQNILKQINMY